MDCLAWPTPTRAFAGQRINRKAPQDASSLSENALFCHAIVSLAAGPPHNNGWWPNLDLRPAGVPAVTNDVHYLQYIPAAPGGRAATLAAAPPSRFASCPFAPGPCKSLAPHPQNGTHTVPPPPPAAPADDTASGAQSYSDCPAQLSSLGPADKGIYQLRVCVVWSCPGVVCSCRGALWSCRGVVWSDVVLVAPSRNTTCAHAHKLRPSVSPLPCSQASALSP